MELKTDHILLIITTTLFLIFLGYWAWKSKTTISEPFLMKLDFPENTYFKIKLEIDDDVKTESKNKNKKSKKNETKVKLTQAEKKQLAKEKSDEKKEEEKLKKERAKDKKNNTDKKNDKGNKNYMYLDVEFDHDSDITKPILSPLSNSLGQQWYQKDGKIYNRLNHLVLSVYKDIKADGVPIFLTISRHTNGQYWIIDDSGIIRSRLTGGRLSYSINNENIVIKLNSSRSVDGFLQNWIVENTNESVIESKLTTEPKIDPQYTNEHIKELHKQSMVNILKKVKSIV